MCWGAGVLLVGMWMWVWHGSGSGPFKHNGHHTALTLYPHGRYYQEFTFPTAHRVDGGQVDRWRGFLNFNLQTGRHGTKKSKGENPGSARLDAAPPDLVRGRNRAPVQHITSACATLDFYSMKGTHNADTSQRKDDGCKCELFRNVFREVLNYSYHCTVLGVIQVPPSPQIK